MGSSKQIEKDFSSLGQGITRELSNTVTSLEEIANPQLAVARKQKSAERSMLGAAEQAKAQEIEARKQAVQSIYEAIGKRRKSNTLLTQTGQGPRFSDQQSIRTLLTRGQNGNV